MSEQQVSSDAGAVESASVESQEVQTQPEKEFSESLQEEQQLEVSSEKSTDASVQAETPEEFEKEVEQAIEEGATEQEIQDMVREFTLKVNGKEFVKKIDLNDEESLKKELQLAAAGRQSMQDLAEIKKLYSSEIERLRDKSQMTKVLRELGYSEDDLIDVFASEINQYLEKSQRPKEEIEAEKRQKEFEQIKKEREELEKKLKDKERQEKMQAMEKEIETDILSALDGDPDLPNTPEVISMVADNMIWALSKGYEDITAKDVIPTVKRDLQNKFRNIANSLKSPAALKSLLGDDVLGKLREERLEQAKKVSNAKSIKESGVNKKPEENKERKKVKLSDFMS